MTDSIARLRAAGVSVWLDDLSRERLRSGSLAALRDRGVSGVTTNPTIFARAISDSDAYDGQIRDLKLRRVPVDQMLRELTASDVRQACDVLRPAYEATGGVDGRVSIEVDPRIAHDTGHTVAEARALWHWANALHQPRTAAAAMLGRDAAYDRVPYFYTDQYDLGMEYAGYAAPGGYDRVVFRGDVAKREFIAFWLSGGRVIAGMNVNIWDINDMIQDLIRSGRAADPARLADPAVPLDEVTAAHDRGSP